MKNKSTAPEPVPQPPDHPVIWRYLTVYLSGVLDFPDTVERAESLKWAGRALSQQLNEYARQGWDVVSIHWLSDVELMVIFRRQDQSE